MHPRVRYEFQQWLPRATRFAKTLRGRPLTEVEQYILNVHCERHAYFLVFGIQPETQNYIDATIRMLEEVDPDDDESLIQCLVMQIRLNWSIKELLRRK